jgi:hypothetical protein
VIDYDKSGISLFVWLFSKRLLFIIRFLEQKLFRLIGTDMRDSCGRSGTGETHRRYAPRRLTARPTESEHPGAAINHSQYLLYSNKVCENSFLFFRIKIADYFKINLRFRILSSILTNVIL